MKGLYFTRRDELNQQPAHPQADALKLLAKQGDLEIMHQQILRGASVWLTPGDSDTAIEFFYICSGSIRFTCRDWNTVLSAGDCFHTRSLEQEVVLDILEDTDLLYVSNTPVFDGSAIYQTELINLLRAIDEKDHYTLQHSVNVRNYSLQLWQKFPQRQTGAYGDMVVSSLFHDVGKCHVPDEVLKKPGHYTPEEYSIMKRHAAASGEILTGHFPDAAAAFARLHHERLDGSGYPEGLRGDQIPFESRVIAVADAFDAMTTSRIYSAPRSMEDAALELCALPSIMTRRSPPRSLPWSAPARSSATSPSCCDPLSFRAAAAIPAAFFRVRGPLTRSCPCDTLVRR